MIVLDTNVLSERMRPRPAPQVLAWLDAQPPASLWQIAAVALAHNAPLATRNIADFTHIETLALINPWDFCA